MNGDEGDEGKEEGCERDGKGGNSEVPGNGEEAGRDNGGTEEDEAARKSPPARGLPPAPAVAAECEHVVPEWLRHGERINVMRNERKYGALVHIGGAGGLHGTHRLFAMDDGGWVQKSTKELFPLLNATLLGPRLDDGGEIGGSPADAAAAFTMTPGHGTQKPFVAGVLIGQATAVGDGLPPHV